MYLMNHEYLRFIPSKVEGLLDVTEVTVYPDRIEFQTAKGIIKFRFFDIAKWPRPRWLKRLLFRLSRRPSPVYIGAKDWFHPPSERFFEFFTQPTITVYMPHDEPEGYRESYFLRTQEVMGRGGFKTIDLG